MEIESQSLLATFCQPQKNDILVDQLKQISIEQGLELKRICDQVYTLNVPLAKEKGSFQLVEKVMESLNNVEGLTFGIANKSISLRCNDKTKQELETELNIPIESIEIVDENITLISYESVELKQSALQAIISHPSLSTLLVYDSLTLPHNDVSTHDSNFSSRNSIEQSPEKKRDNNINGKRRFDQFNEINIPPMIVGEEEEENLKSSQQLNESENIENTNEKQEEVDQSIEPALKKKNKISQGLEVIDITLQSMLLLFLIGVLFTRIMRGFQN